LLDFLPGSKETQINEGSDSHSRDGGPAKLIDQLEWKEKKVYPNRADREFSQGQSRGIKSLTA
jgi:hypothetical protein